MGNTWKIIWTDKEGKRRLKRFGDVKEAIAKRDSLREAGLDPNVVSAVHAFAIPKLDKKGKPHRKSQPPSGRHIWCPYCIEWRLFSVSAIRFDGISSPEANRCPVCTISDEDFHVKKMNHRLGVVDDEKLYKGVTSMHRVKA